MRRFFLTRIVGMGLEGMIECLALDVLRMGRQMGLHRKGKIVIGLVRHGLSPSSQLTESPATPEMQTGQPNLKLAQLPSGDFCEL
jgi:hypothetical protein